MKRVFIIVTPILLIIIAASVFYFFSRQKTNAPSVPFVVSPVSNTGESKFNYTPAPTNEGEYNILLLGLGGAGHPGGILTDSMMVIRLDTKNKAVSLIFIPRDLWVEFPNGKAKINEAYLKGGFPLVKNVVSNVTGLSIQYGVVIDFNQFVQMINSLGGIDIKVAKTFDDYFYPVPGKELELCGKPPEEVSKLNSTLSGFELEKQFTCRYEHLHFDQGTAHINGETALKYARSRHSIEDGSDFGRGARQQIILIGLKDKFLSLNALKNIDKYFKNLVSFVKTDLSLETVKAIAALITNPEDYKISQIVPSDANVLKAAKGTGGAAILIPKAGDGNWREFQYLIKK